jgi:hypothetical protein
VGTDAAGPEQAAPSRRACQKIIARLDVQIPDEAALHVARCALLHASASTLRLAHTWLRAASIGPAHTEPLPYRDAVLAGADTRTTVHVAYACALAADELRTAADGRERDERDAEHVAHLVMAAGYIPTADERDLLARTGRR